MNIRELGSRGVLFTYDDQISVYLIHTPGKIILCDTHLGPQSMQHVKDYITARFAGRDLIVFNSHSDWDHVWGNCAFPDAMIIGHHKCRERLQEIGPYDLERLTSYHRGDIVLKLPNVTFSEKMAFEDDEVEFIHAPGHTADSAVCFDKRDSVLFVGDLVEEPIPYLDFFDLQTYVDTLEWLRNFPAKVKISAHSGIIPDELIVKNIGYINDILNEKPVEPEVYRNAPEVHNFNINNRLFLHYESLVREKTIGNFNFHDFRDWFGDLKKIDTGDLKDALERYMAGIAVRNQNGVAKDE